MLTQKMVNDIAYKAVGCAMEVHKHLGAGLLESVYHSCMIEECKIQGLEVKTEVYVPIYYKGILIKERLRIDLLIENTVVIELKAVRKTYSTAPSATSYLS